MKAAVEKTNRPEVVGGLGGFAGLFALDTAKYRKPLLASSTDGVGTKIALARQLDRHDTVGIDLVAMVVDDLVACGAEPLFLQDYVACGKVVPERIAAIVTGIAAGCTLAGAALVGGETAEHGDLMDADEYDLAATAVGVVEADAVLGPERVRDGDVVIAMASSGFHSNGYSLVRRVVRRRRARPAPPPRPGSTGRSARSCSSRPASTPATAWRWSSGSASSGVHAFAHITGGGLAGNTARVVPDGLEAVLDRAHVGAARRRPAAGGARRAARGVRARVQLRRRHGRRRRRRRSPTHVVAQLTAARRPGLGRRHACSTARATRPAARLVGTYR